MLTHVRTMARYNRWANEELYRVVAAMSADDIRRDVGAFFGSIHATLNHILLGDRIWFTRLDGETYPVTGLDMILYEDFAELGAARAAEDDAIVARMDALDAAGIERVVDFKTVKGDPMRSPVREMLATVFNHQTHHRGQVHDMISRLGGNPPPLDLILYYRTAAG